MAEQVKVPAIRFAGFTDPWEQRKLGDVADLLTGYPFESRHFTDTGIPLVRGMNVKRGYLDMSADICENWSDAVGVEDYLLKAGDIVIQMDGALIGSSYAMVTPENTPSLLVQRVTRVRCGNRSRYIFQAVQRGFLRYIKSLKTETAVPHLSLSDIADYAIPVPKEEREQEHIGSFFSRLDDLITLHQRKYDKLVVFKKSMLEKMFPKDGESVPEIRFAGFTDPWEQRKLGELFFESNERSSSMEILSVSVTKGIYPASESDRDTNPGASLVNYKVVHKGDVVYNSMRMWQGAVGSSDYDGIVSPAYVVARPTIELDSTCFGYLLKRPEMLYKYLCDSQGNSKDTQTLKYDRFADIKATMPANLEEQRAISACLGSVDHLITLHQRKRQWLKWLDEGGEGTHHDIDILVFKFADDMKISVLCGVHACMTKSLGHTGNRYAGKQQQRGMGVP